MPINSASMNLPIPVPSVDSGPQWATSLQSCLTIVDSHSHQAGSGVPIQTNAININADLTFNSFNLTNPRTIRFAPQLAGFTPAASDKGCLLEIGTDLYYYDGSGTQVRITQSGSVAVSGAIGFTGLTAPASASYSSSTFVFQSNVNTSANIDAGSLILRNNTVSSNGLTLAPPTLGSDYTITLPPLPVSQKIMTIDSSGTMAAPYTVDGSTITIAANVIGVPAGGIATAQLASQAVTAAKIATGTITGSQVANNTLNDTQMQVHSISSTSINQTTLDFGTYNPTFTPSANISSLTILTAQWMRVGNVCTVSGQFNVVPQSPGGIGFTMSLPFNGNNFSAGNQAGGCCISQQAPNNINNTLFINAASGTARASVGGDLVTVTSYDFNFTLTYQIQ